MSKQPAMVITVHAHTKTREVSVVVEHENWQSFSRAVGPHATRAFKTWVREHIVFGQLAKTSASLAHHTVRDQPKRCISVFNFSY